VVVVVVVVLKCNIYFFCFGDGKGETWAADIVTSLDLIIDV
jgi:hypothetical protein